MKLYAREKVLTLRDRFRFFNEKDEDVFLVEGKFWSFTKQLTMTDPLGNEVALIKEKFLTFLPRFTVLQNGAEVASIQKRFTFLRPKYTLEYKGWDIEGDVWSHNYSIVDGVRTVATVHKRWFTIGDVYELDIADPADAVLVAAVVLCIDCVDERQAAASSASASNASSN
ncbi:MAG: LURP-one-related family protein [Oscillospiraceae bacterium]|nr:LURP-one-related family protein [Oscillospiraceae bacterium]